MTDGWAPHEAVVRALRAGHINASDAVVRKADNSISYSRSARKGGRHKPPSAELLAVIGEVAGKWLQLKSARTRQKGQEAVADGEQIVGQAEDVNSRGDALILRGLKLKAEAFKAAAGGVQKFARLAQDLSA